MTDARGVLRHLHSAVQRRARLPEADPSAREAVDGLVKALESLVRHTGSAEFRFGGTITLDGDEIAGASIEFGGLAETMVGVGLGVVGFVAPIDPDDVGALVGRAAGGDQAVGASVRIGTAAAAPARRPGGGSVGRAVGDAQAVVAASQVDVDRAAAAGEALMSVSATDPERAFVTATSLASDPAAKAAAVVLVSGVVAEALGMDDESRRTLGLAGLLADIGLQDEGDPRSHPIEGARRIFLAGGPGSEVAAAVALEHHVRVDGTGYPLIERPVHPFSRIVAVADAYCTLVGGVDRRSARTPAGAIRALRGGVGTDFDAGVVDALVGAVGETPAGSLVRLADGEVALVRSADGPAVVLTDRSGERLDVPLPADLADLDVVDELLPDEAGVAPADLPVLLV